MKDLTTGKVYLSRRTIKELGPDFARAGYDIRHLHDEKSIANAFLDTLSDSARAKLKAEMDRRAKTDAKKTTPSR